MPPALEALRVELGDVLRSGWARGKPAVSGGYFEAADGGVVARGFGELLENGVAREFGFGDGARL